MWVEGFSAVVIANKIGKTRNAVIGKLSRLGIKKSELNITSRAKGQKKSVLPQKTKKKPDVHPPEIERVEQKLTLLYLTEKTCRWPIGDPATRNFWFCGKPVQAGKRYCTQHGDLALQPNSAKKERNTFTMTNLKTRR